MSSYYGVVWEQGEKHQHDGGRDLKGFSSFLDRKTLWLHPHSAQHHSVIWDGHKDNALARDTSARSL